MVFCNGLDSLDGDTAISRSEALRDRVPMHRRTFVKTAAAGGFVSLSGEVGGVAQDANTRFPEPAPLSFREEKSGLKITGIRVVRLVPKRPLPT